LRQDALEKFREEHGISNAAEYVDFAGIASEVDDLEAVSDYLSEQDIDRHAFFHVSPSFLRTFYTPLSIRAHPTR